MLDDGLSVVDRLFSGKSTIGIEGKWDYERAGEICLKKLRNYGDGKKFGFNCTGREDCKMRDSIIGFYSMEIDENPAFIGLTCSRPNFQDCHACGVSISIFEFIKKDYTWILNSSVINAMQAGAWGEPSNIEVENIGHNKYGLIERSGFSNMGYTEGSYLLLAYLGDGFQSVFSTESFWANYGGIGNESNIGDTWETKVTFVKEGTGFYDLIATTEGIMKGKKIFKKKRFRFNGIEYVETY